MSSTTSTATYKMSVVQRKAMLKSEGFFPHKKNAKGTNIIYSRKHPTAKFVRVVIDSGIDNKTNKVVGKVGVKLCFVNRQKSWREITTEIFSENRCRNLARRSCLNRAD